MSDVEKAKQALSGPRLLNTNLSKSDFLSTGSTLLNLALTGRFYGGFVKGSYVLFVGDTDSGKTFICMTCLAEAAINPDFDDYRFILINKERGMLMDVEHFFGSRVANRLEVVYSENLEDMYFDLDDFLKGDKPFICIVDSIDALSSEYEGKKFNERKTAARKGTEAKGDYGDGKAKIHSGNIRQVLSGLERTGSIIIFINQSRDNINAGLFETKTTHSGGRAISFYATQKMWSKVKKSETKIYKGKDRQIGILSKIDVKRSRFTGRRVSVEVPIFHSFGIDDVGSCVDFLTSEKHWTRSKSGVIQADDFDFSGRKEVLIKHIEDNDYEFDLRTIVASVWKDIEDACKVERKSKYI